MSRLSEIFADRGKCFIPFITAGHPDLRATEEIVLALAEAGSDIIEIGIPFSDPIADGPIIQKASFEALRHRHSVSDYIRLVARLRERTEAGLIFMTYLNPLLKYGLERFDREASEAGLDGVLISDLTPEEYLHQGVGLRLDTIFLAAPTSSEARLSLICRVCRGFVYVIARTGVTGAPSEIGVSLKETVQRVRRLTGLPVAVGFGIRTPEDARRVWEIAEGAIVGSEIVRLIDQHRHDPALAATVGAYARSFTRPAGHSHRLNGSVE
jgi:tryptophan synthase alpha chain